MINHTPPQSWFTYKQDVLAGRAVKDHRPLTEPELYYSTLTESEQMNFNAAARRFFADDMNMRNKNDRYLRSIYYWEVKE